MDGERGEGTLGIIGCRMFEDEMAYVISTDSKISRTYVVKNDDSADLVGKLRSMPLHGTVTVIDEEELPPVGIVELRDAETGESMLVDTSNRAVRERYREANQLRQIGLGQGERRAGVNRRQLRPAREEKRKGDIKRAPAAKPPMWRNLSLRRIITC